MSQALTSERAEAGASEAQQPSKARLRHWFPIRCDMVGQNAFPGLSVCEKLVLLDVNYRLHEHFYLVEHGLRQGPFCMTDQKWADRLRMSAETFQNARVKLGRPIDKTPKTPGLGWVVYGSGFRVDGKAVATRYHDAVYAKTQSGEMCGALWRQTWADLISDLQRERLGHADLVAFAMVGYWWKVTGGTQHGSVMVPKAEIKKRAGMSKARFNASLGRLRSIAPGLLAFQEEYRHLKISTWKGGPDSRNDIADF